MVKVFKALFSLRQLLAGELECAYGFLGGKSTKLNSAGWSVIFLLTKAFSSLWETCDTEVMVSILCNVLSD